MNAGYLPIDHWVHGSQGGGRNIGEACHIYDIFTYLTDSRIEKISVNSIRPNTKKYNRNDNFITTLTFKDGSICSLTYTALGNEQFPKESAKIFYDGQVVTMNDYKTLDIIGKRKKSYKNTLQDKGHKSELISFAKGISSGEWPIPWWQQKQIAKIALDVEKIIFS